MNEVTVGILGIIVVLALFVTGIELGFAMAIVGFPGLSYPAFSKAALLLIRGDFFDLLSIARLYCNYVKELLILSSQVRPYGRCIARTATGTCGNSEEQKGVYGSVPVHDKSPGESYKDIG